MRKKFFSRNKETAGSEMVSAKTEGKVICGTFEFQIITKWTHGEGWEFNDFATFVELIGVKTPIKVMYLKKEGLLFSFKCITALNKEVKIHIRFGDFDEFAELWIEEGAEETRKYYIGQRDEEEAPKVDLYERTVIRNGKELGYYDRFHYITLKIDDAHMLSLETNVPVLETQQIEEYLLNLDNFIIVQVYNKVKELLGLYEEDISISYTETIGKRKVK